MGRLGVCFACLLTVLPVGAFAQVTPDLVVYRDGERIPNQQSSLFVSVADCDDNAHFRFESQGATGSGDLTGFFLQAWAGPSSCRDTSSRTDATGSADCERATCSLVDEVRIDSADGLPAITRTAWDLFGDGSGCTASGRRSVTLVAVAQTSCAAADVDVLPSEHLARFELRTEPPSAPTEVELNPTEGELTVAWEADTLHISDRFPLYVDTRPGLKCEETWLMEGMSVADADALTEMGNRVQRLQAPSESYTLRAEGLGVEAGDFVAVAVVMEEGQTLNRSELSTIACARMPAAPNQVAQDAAVTRAPASSKGCAAATTPVGGTAPLLWTALLTACLTLRRRRGPHAAPRAHHPSSR